MIKPRRMHFGIFPYAYVSITRNEIARLYVTLFLLHIVAVLQSCSNGPVESQTPSADPVPAEIQIATFKGTSINLANRVTDQGDLAFTILDTSGEFYSLCTYNLLTKETKKLSTIPALWPNRDRSHVAILDVVVNEQKIMILSEMSWLAGDGGNHSNFWVDILDRTTGKFESRELRGSGEVSSRIRSPFPSWLSASGVPAIYIQGTGNELPSMVSDVGKDRYEFNVRQLRNNSVEFDLSIKKIPYDTTTMFQIEYESGSRPPSSTLFQGRLLEKPGYSGALWTSLGELQLAGTGWNAHANSWVGSFNAVMIEGNLYFMLNDAILMLRNGQVKLATTIGLNQEDIATIQWYSRFTANDSRWRNDGHGKDRVGVDGSSYRKIYQDGEMIYVAVDNHRLYAFDTGSGTGQMIPTDTAASALWQFGHRTPVAEYFITGSSIWEVWSTPEYESSKGELGAIVHLDRRGVIQHRYRVPVNAWDRTDAGDAMVLALEDRNTKSVTLCLMHPISASDFIGRRSPETEEVEDVYWDPEEDVEINTVLDSTVKDVSAQQLPSERAVMELKDVQEPPSFPGGEEALFDFLKRSVHYPETEQDAGIQGIVYLTFVVQRDGSIRDVKTLRGVSEGLDREAMRAVRSMPRWTPGRSKGSAVDVQYNMPVRFTLR